MSETKDFIYYDGRYWLVEKYDADVVEGGGWFAAPIYFKEGNIAEARPAGGNWCYACNGAFYKDPERQVMEQAYQSWIAHLEWTKSMIVEHKDETEKIDKHLSFFRAELAKVSA